jgi:hypothetical protein
MPLPAEDLVRREHQPDGIQEAARGFRPEVVSPVPQRNSVVKNEASGTPHMADCVAVVVQAHNPGRYRFRG